MTSRVLVSMNGTGVLRLSDCSTASPRFFGSIRESNHCENGSCTVQRQREWPTRIIQAVQSFVQKRLIATVLSSQNTMTIPGSVRVLFSIPVLRDIPARLVAFGVRRVHVETASNNKLKRWLVTLRLTLQKSFNSKWVEPGPIFPPLPQARPSGGASRSLLTRWHL